MALDFGKGNRSIAFDPTSAFPLDTRSYFESLAAAEEAAASAKPAGDTTSVYYFGQTLTVIENETTKFYIIQTDGTLKELGDTDTINAINAELQELISVTNLKDGTKAIPHAYYARYYTNRDGTIPGNSHLIRPTIHDALDAKLDADQGLSNAGKALIVNASGRVVPGNPTIAGSVEVAKKLETARTIGLTGDIVTSSTFDGTQDVLLNITVPGSIVTGTYHNTGLGAFTPAGSTTPITSFRTDRLYLDTSSDTNYHNRFYISKDGITLTEFKLNLDDIYTKTETDNKISISLSNYYTKSDVNNLLSGYVVSSTLNNYVTATALNTTLNNYVVKSTLNSYYTKSEIDDILGKYYATISSIPAWAKAATKPTYTAAEVGAATEDFVIIEINKALTSGGEVDLSHYYTAYQTTTHVSNALSNYYSKDQTITHVNAALASYHTKAEISDLLDNKSTVNWEQEVTSGTKIATISINGETTDIYAPTSSTSGGTDTDEKVKQVSDTSSTEIYPLLFKNSTGTSTTTDSVKFNSNIYVQPSNGKLYGRLIYSDCYYASDGTKLDDIYATKTEAAASGKTVSIQAIGASANANNKFKIPYSSATADTGYTGELNQSDKFAFNPATYALTIGNYTNPWEKTFITNEGLTIERYYFTGVSESTSKVSDTYRIKAIYANGEGGLYAKKYYTNGSDFAEYFEWLDGNPNNEDRCGLLVTLEGECIRPANADDECIGAITGSASYIGNAYDNEWQGKYLTDVYGRPLTKEVQVPAQVDAITGEVVQAAYTTQEYVINPEYNPMTPYVSRTERREWATVGLTGQVVVRDDGTCVVGSHLAPLSNGIGTISDKGYKVMKRIDANHVKILIK